MVATIYGAEKDVYLVGTQQLYSIGQKLETPAGDIFRFTEMGGVVGIANKLFQASAIDSNWGTQDIGVAMAIGDTTISFKDGGTSLVADEAVGGTLIAEETADLGHIYRVKSNVATSSNETVMALEDGVAVIVAVAVASSNALTFIKNTWKDTIISPAAVSTGAVAGVQRVIIAADGFGWTQTRGVASCVVDADTDIPLVGNGLRASEDDAGGVALLQESGGTADYQLVGYCLETTPNLMFGHLFLTLE